MNPFRNFIFYRFVVGSGENRIKRVLLFFFVFYGFCLLAAWIDGLLVIKGEKYGLLEDVAFFANIIANFFLIIYTAQLPKLFIHTFKGTEGHFNFETGIFNSIRFNSIYTTEHYKSDFSRCYDMIIAKNKTSKRILTLLILGGAAAQILAQIRIYSGEGTNWAYQSEYKLTFIAQFISNFFLWWFIYPETILLTVATMFVMVKLVKEFSKQKVIVLSPVAKDERGGMTPITKLCFYMVKILFLPLLFLFGYMIVNGFRLESFFSLFLYVIFMILTFVYPLSFIHWSMKQYKERELLKVEKLFKTYYSKYQELLGEENPSKQEIREVADSLVSTDNLFNLIKKLPVWPYDFKIISRFFSLIMIPIIVLVIQLITNADSILFNLDKLSNFNNLLGF